jgi:cytoskeleton protein RodZ
VETEIGPTLREARIRRKIDLTEVEQRTKIRVRYLRALENEEWDLLPGGTYNRSFIRTYASFLGLDGERLADDYRRAVEERPSEAHPRGEPVGLPPRPASARGGGPRLGAGALAALISAGLIAVLLVLGLTGGSDDDGSGAKPAAAAKRQEAIRKQKRQQQRAQAQPGSPVSVNLTATGDVWVCLVDEGGTPVVNGQILTTGAQEGPFRSRHFKVRFGNGNVAMQVNGKDAEVAETGSPVGYEIDSGGRVRPIPDGEQPSCA